MRNDKMIRVRKETKVKWVCYVESVVKRNELRAYISSIRSRISR
jgi:hypothetical protein